jgi:hypothetical protein
MKFKLDKEGTNNQHKCVIIDVVRASQEYLRINHAHHE